MKLISFLFLCPFLVFVLSCQHSPVVVSRDIASLKRTGEVEGIWFLQGTSSLRGPYNGELELRKSFDGTYDVVRIITYINFFYDGLKVQEVWTGKAVANNDSIVISYDLRQGDYIRKIGNEKRANGEAEKILNVVSELRSNEYNIIVTQFSDTKDSGYQEWVSTRRELERTPLWSANVEFQDLKGASVRGTDRSKVLEQQSKVPRISLADESKKTKQISREISEVKKFKDNSDLNFYQKNNDTVRVVNKIVDNISIAESVSQRNAYAITVAQKTYSYEQNTKNNHFNSLGLIVAAEVKGNGNLKNTQLTKDNVFLTSIFTSTLAAKSLVTQSELDQDDLRRSILNILRLTNYSMIKNLPISGAQAVNPAGYLGSHEGWQKHLIEGREVLIYPDDKLQSAWAIVHANLWAIYALPEKDQALKNQILDVTKRYLRSLDLRNLPQAEFVKTLLSGLESTGDSAFGKAAFEKSLQELAKKTSYPNARIYYYNGASAWEENFQEYLALDSLKVSCAILNHTNCMQTFESLAASYSQALKYVQLPYVEFLNPQNLKSSGKPKDNDSIAGFLGDMPYPRSNSELVIDQGLKKNWMVSVLTDTQTNAKEGKAIAPKKIRRDISAAVMYPIYELGAYSSSFLLNENPFKVSGKVAKGFENPAVDYLYVYWMSRHLNLVSE